MGTELVFNGINGATGGYLLPNLTAQDIGKLARREVGPAAHQGA